MGNKIDNKINNLDNLLEIAGKDKTDKIFMEYIMDILAKSRRFDDILKAVNPECNIEDIKDILDGDDFDGENIFN